MSRSSALLVVVALAAAGCSGISTETASEPSGAASAGTVEPTPTTEDPPATSEAPPATEAETTTDSTTAPTTEPPGTTAPPQTMEVELPTGPIVADGDDGFVVTPGGVLYWHQDLFAETIGEPLRVAGTASDNDIESIAGVVDGAVILGLCCAVPEGQVSATTGDAAVSLARGWRSDLGRDGAALVTVGDRDITVVDLTSGTGRVQEVPDDGGIVPLDVIWSGESPIVLGDRSGELVLAFLDADTLTLGEPVATGFSRDDGTYAEFAGLGPDGEVALVHAPGDDADVALQAYDIDTLQPVETLTRTLPAGVRSVRVRSAGDVIWVDDGTVWRTVAGESEPLGGGAAAVWFAVE